jgi:hypothetical protein
MKQQREGSVKKKGQKKKKKKKKKNRCQPRESYTKGAY